MAKGYWVVRVTVTNEADYPDYLKAGAPVYAEFGGRFVVRGGRHEVMEGSGRPRNVIVEWADYETALAAYHSPAYQAAKAIRDSHAEADFLIVEGYDTDS